MRPDELERQLQANLDALPKAARAELLHVLMLPDLERAERIGLGWRVSGSLAVGLLLAGAFTLGLGIIHLTIARSGRRPVRSTSADRLYRAGRWLGFAFVVTGLAALTVAAVIAICDCA